MLSRSSGWPYKELLGMSYAVGCQWLHCHLLYQGTATRWAYADADEVATVEEEFNKYLKRK